MKERETRILTPEEGLPEAVRELRMGGLVAFPTETVYGLGAIAADGEAVRKIFAAKGRASDNPLIVHVGGIDMAKSLCVGWDERAQRLAEQFWPGPLSLVLRRNARVHADVSAGMPTVALRMPKHPVALALIRGAGPIAAPSANSSGKPSPTCAQHVYEDLAGKVPIILDGGHCERGLESTVLDIAGPHPTLYRPGGVTLAQLQAIVGDVAVSPGVNQPVLAGNKVSSPGLLHRHYAPVAKVKLWMGDPAAQVRQLQSSWESLKAAGVQPVILWMGAEPVDFGNCRSWQSPQAAREYYGWLRLADQLGATHVLLGGIDETDAALVNRALRSADFQVTRV